jgi:hypothetical protein
MMFQVLNMGLSGRWQFAFSAREHAGSTEAPTATSDARLRVGI